MVIKGESDFEVSDSADAAMKALVELFSNLKGPCKRRCAPIITDISARAIV